ncbi:MAG: Ribosomal protein L3 N(5)-glutamine methyltransferase [Burkholderiaceae bacterium]|jgi:ribosomal protein L3 glutamine methyltransferase|nr:MAG: Ribosomal protein L3 N(5)-glutamine methyltransferase [Burkholderiaceae bacterium]
MTLSDLVTDIARQLTEAGACFGHGTGNAHDEAAWLVLHALGLPLDTDLHDAQANQAITLADRSAVATLLEARITTRQPLAYLTHEAWLQGVPFYVDERTIVPRSLIAEVIAAGSIDPWLPSGPAPRVLDLCTGGGSLAVLAALAWPAARVDASDISADALAVARINVDRHGLQRRITLLSGDGLAGSAGRYDLILCNPPYVNAASMAALPAEYRSEPAIALAGGADGMDFVRRLLRDAPMHMNDQAALVLEIGHERAHFEAAFPRLEALWLDTSAGIDQVLLLTRDALAGANRRAGPE